MRPRLVLFDIDGTLVRCGGAGRRALDLAFADLWNVDDALHGVRLDGSTDAAILESVYKSRNREFHGLSHAADLVERYLFHLERGLSDPAAPYAVLPGAKELVTRAARAAHLLVGLATGNIEPAARIKLERGGLNPHLSFGGFGSDAHHRVDVVRTGIRRGQTLAQERFGRTLDQAETVVVGDTELDVRAARNAGAVSVGVLFAASDRGALAREGPDLLVDSLDDPRLFALLGL